VLTCSLRKGDAACFAEIRRRTIRSTHAVFRGPWGSFATLLPLSGEHNVFNALQAAAACFAIGADRHALESSLSQCTAPPGRLEPVTGPDDPFTVLVDYAHTDDALASVLRTLRGLVPEGGRLRVVFGCGGDRDRSKRPRMGRVAAELADELIVTSDNPRTEDRSVIIDDIVAGVPTGRSADLSIVVDRAQAIEHAVEWSRPGDVVLIAGKGHEPYQIVGTRKRPFDDRRVAARALVRHGAVATG
jgi:UDP-N-acetylmuramoyl-L-alanyl-D-glutamate--2,6-diaminopimelate ligase